MVRSCLQVSSAVVLARQCRSLVVPLSRATVSLGEFDKSLSVYFDRPIHPPLGQPEKKKEGSKKAQKRSKREEEGAAAVRRQESKCRCRK